MRFQRQPTPTSCGPTCVAMLTGQEVKEILVRLPGVRTPARDHIRTHKTNYGEIQRLLECSSVRLYSREPGWPSVGTRAALLRIAHPYRHGWHWVVQCGDHVYDPARPRPLRCSTYRRQVAVGRVGHYVVTWSRPAFRKPTPIPSKNHVALSADLQIGRAHV